MRQQNRVAIGKARCGLGDQPIVLGAIPRLQGRHSASMGLVGIGIASDAAAIASRNAEQVNRIASARSQRHIPRGS